MKNKRGWMIGLVLVLVFVFAVGCGGSTGGTRDDDLELTLEELAEFNGKDGKPAYVAVDGVIYDVSGSDRWGQGEHNGFSAGNDLTEEIKTVSPHGISTLSRMPIVGKIVE